MNKYLKILLIALPFIIANVLITCFCDDKYTISQCAWSLALLAAMFTRDVK